MFFIFFFTSPESGFMVRNGQKYQNIGIHFQNWGKKIFDGEIWKIGENVTFFTLKIFRSRLAHIGQNRNSNGFQTISGA